MNLPYFVALASMLRFMVLWPWHWSKRERAI